MVPITKPPAIFRSGSIYAAVEFVISDPEIKQKVMETWLDVDVNWLAGFLGSGKKEPLARWILVHLGLDRMAWSLLLDHDHPFLPLYQIMHLEDPGAMAVAMEPDIQRILEKNKVWESKHYRDFLAEVRKIVNARKVMEA
jgi:hypothetical protein